MRLKEILRDMKEYWLYTLIGVLLGPIFILGSYWFLKRINPHAAKNVWKGSLLLYSATILFLILVVIMLPASLFEETELIVPEQIICDEICGDIENSFYYHITLDEQNNDYICECLNSNQDVLSTSHIPAD